MTVAVEVCGLNPAVPLDEIEDYDYLLLRLLLCDLICVITFDGNVV